MNKKHCFCIGIGVMLLISFILIVGCNDADTSVTGPIEDPSYAVTAYESAMMSYENKTEVCDKKSIKTNTGIKIMPLGNSLTQGHHLAKNKKITYRKKLYEKLEQYNVDFVGSNCNGSFYEDFDINHQGVCGASIGDISKDIDKWLDAHNPDVILLHIGTNNCMGVSKEPVKEKNDAFVKKVEEGTEKLKNQVETLLNQIKDNKKHNNVITLVARICKGKPNGSKIKSRYINDVIESYNNKIAALVNNKYGKYRNNQGDPRFKIVNMPKLNDNDFRDDLHLENSGYEKMADAWYNAIKTLKTLKKQPENIVIKIKFVTARSEPSYQCKINTREYVTTEGDPLKITLPSIPDEGDCDGLQIAYFISFEDGTSFDPGATVSVTEDETFEIYWLEY